METLYNLILVGGVVLALVVAVLGFIIWLSQVSGRSLTSNCPRFKESPSSTSRSLISPETSGAIFTSVTGCTVPDALTFSTIVTRFTFANSTSISLGFPIQPALFATTRKITIKSSAPMSQ